MTPRKDTTRQRLVAKVIIREATGCWEWQSTIDKGGYARLTARGPDGNWRLALAHRVSYELFVGPIPEGYDLDHVCHTNHPTCQGGPSCIHRRCVNPDHLALMLDRDSGVQGGGRAGPQRGAVQQAKTHCPKGHEYTPENTYPQRGGKGRGCRICKNESNRANGYWYKPVENPKPYAERNWHRKITDADLPRIREMKDSGMSLRAIASEFGVTHGRISAALNRTT